MLARPSPRWPLMPLAASLCGLLVLWQLAASFLGLPRVVLPGPLDVLAAFHQQGAYIARNVGITLAEAVAGFLIGGLLAVALAFAFEQSALVRQAFYPIALALKTTPLIVLAPLLVVWLGSGVRAKIVMAAILAFFPILVAMYDGLRATEKSFIELFHMHGARARDILLGVRFPFALPQLFSGLRVAVPLAVVGAVIGEYSGAAYGVGYVIANASYHLDTALVFACIFSLSAMSLTLFAVVSLVERRILFWSSSSGPNSKIP